jgi:hypothetical protein
MDVLDFGRPASSELAPDRVHEVGQDERGRSPRGESAGRDEGAEAARVQGSRPERVAGGQSAAAPASARSTTGG